MITLPRITLCVASFFFFAYDACTQQASSPPRTTVMHMGAPSAHMPVVTGAPYSAEVVTEHMQTLADGTHITQKSQSAKEYRDSDGRSRQESSPAGVQVVEIIDPVSGFRYLLDVQNQVAHRFGPPADRPNEAPGYKQNVSPNSSPKSSVPPKSVTPVEITAGRPETSTESLGSQIIEGVLAEGKKTTTIFPVNSMGNDRPLVRVTESWFSPDLKRTLISKNSDPRTGESTMRLQNINRSEPDPALFRVPPEYQIVNENSDRIEIRVSQP